MQLIYSGECPYTNSTQSIKVDYKYLPMARTLSSNYKKTKFDCALSKECPHSSNCPIYQKAPKSKVL